MNVSVEAIDMLIERLTNIEINQEQMLKQLTDSADIQYCPCWISSIQFFPCGKLKQILFFSESKKTCKKCN